MKQILGPAFALFLVVLALVQTGCTSKSQDADPKSQNANTSNQSPDPNDPILNFHPYYPDSEIPNGGLSPNGLFAFALLPPDKAFFKPSPFSMSVSGRGPANCFLTHSTPSSPGKSIWLPNHIALCDDERMGYNGVVRWAKDSSALLLFANGIRDASSVFSRYASEIYVVPIIKGQQGKITNLEEEIFKVPHDDFVKANAEPMNAGGHIWTTRLSMGDYLTI